MFFGFFAFSNLRRVYGFRLSLGEPNYGRYRGEATFFSSRRYGRFSLHSVRCDACTIRLNINFFYVFWFPTGGIPIRQGALFGRQIGSPKREHSKTFQNVQREKRTPNLSIPLSLVRRRLEFADDWSTRVGLSKNCAKFGKSFQIATKLCDFSHGKNEPK